MNDVWILDIEASGLSPASYPIEVGLTSKQQEYQALIMPVASWKHWSPKAEELHGISRQQLYEDGRSADVIAKELNELLGSEIVYSDHQDWDSFWLRRLFETVNIEQTFYVEDIAVLVGSGNLDRFNDIFDELRASTDFRAHRALNDARAIYQAAIRASR